MCQQTVLKFCMLLRETFSNSITLTVINKHGREAVVEIATVFDPFNMLPVERLSETGHSRHLSKHVFRSP